jgi:ribosomal protein L20A (L18A)
MDEEKTFTVEGEIHQKKETKKFSKKIKAKTPQFAAEKALCIFGSKNRLKRSQITIKETKEVQKDA